MLIVSQARALSFNCIEATDKAIILVYFTVPNSWAKASMLPLAASAADIQWIDLEKAQG